MAHTRGLRLKKNPLLRCLAIALWCVAPAGSAQFSFLYDPGQRLWTLSNGEVKAVIQLPRRAIFSSAGLSY
jgi:hypothetical protein